MSCNSAVTLVGRVGSMVFAALLLLPTLAFAQSPWERAAANLERTFTGPLARSLALVSIVIGGLMFMFGEAGAKRQLSGIVFGGGLAFAVLAGHGLSQSKCSRGCPRRGVRPSSRSVRNFQMASPDGGQPGMK